MKAIVASVVIHFVALAAIPADAPHAPSPSGAASLSAPCECDLEISADTGDEFVAIARGPRL